MRQRAMLPDGDYSFGTGLPLLADTPECVAQAILTRLKLQTGEWFLDLSEGTPYLEQILGAGTAATRDLAVRSRILDTPGVKRIALYSSSLDRARDFRVDCTVDTLFGTTSFSFTGG